MESKNIKILWNFNLYTDRKIEARRPDVIHLYILSVVTGKRDKKAKLINLSVPTDHGVDGKEMEKSDSAKISG